MCDYYPVVGHRPASDRCSTKPMPPAAAATLHRVSRSSNAVTSTTTHCTSTWAERLQPHSLPPHLPHLPPVKNCDIIGRRGALVALHLLHSINCCRVHHGLQACAGCYTKARWEHMTVGITRATQACTTGLEVLLRRDREPLSHITALQLRAVYLDLGRPLTSEPCAAGWVGGGKVAFMVYGLWFVVWVRV